MNTPVALSTAKYAIQAKGIDLSALDSTSWVAIGDVKEGTLTITGEAPTENVIKSDFHDRNLVSLLTMGAFTIEADLVDVQKASAQTFLGATVSSESFTHAGVTGTYESYEIPSTAQYIYYQVRIRYASGLKAVRIAKMQVIANITGTNTKTDTLNIHIKLVAVDSGTTDYITMITDSTATGVPALATYTATSILATSANVIWNLGVVGTATEFGVEWDTEPTFASASEVQEDVAGVGSYSTHLIGLDDGVTIYARAYAKYPPALKAVGETISFVTPTGS
ncbi:MAG TPA: hypothetical protein PLQ44_02495 [Candidatus Paceibacterota bacterium]|nr:hypothetical protein [Candidatus Paceibacterota bacterium]